MANVDAPHGLRPLMRTFSGGASQTREFEKPSSVGTAIYRNDSVFALTGGKITPGRDGTVPFVGVANNHGAANATTKHHVICSPDALFEIQDNNDGDGLAAADMGKNALIETNAPAGGYTSPFISGFELDESSAAATAGHDLQILGKLDVPDNAFGANCRVEVMFNRHYFAKGRTAV